MDAIISLFSFLLLELPARALDLLSASPLVVLGVVAVVFLLLMLGRRGRRRRRRR